MQAFGRSVLRLCVVLMAVAWAAGAAAQSVYPSKALRLVCPFPPGGVVDTVSRVVAQKLSESLGQAVIVDNKAGAGGNIAGDATAKAAPDGYSLHWAAPGSAVINHHLNKSMPYAYKDLIPVSLIGIVPLVVIVPTQSPYKSLADLVAAAKANPGKLSYGTPGIGTSNHMATELFLYQAKVRATHVPYKGSAATQDLLAGNLDFIFDSITTATPFITSGRMRPLALTTAMRSPLLPEVTTVAEQGYPGYEASNWYALMAPHGTPNTVIQKLHAEFARASRVPEVEKRMQSLGVIVVASTPDELR